MQSESAAFELIGSGKESGWAEELLTHCRQPSKELAKEHSLSWPLPLYPIWHVVASIHHWRRHGFVKRPTDCIRACLTPQQGWKDKENTCENP